MNKNRNRNKWLSSMFAILIVFPHKFYLMLLVSIRCERGEQCLNMSVRG